MEKQLTDKSLVPVAYQVRMSDGRWGTIFHHPDKPLGDHRPLYAHPPQPSVSDAQSAPDAVARLVEAARAALNYLENTEGEFGITLGSATGLRAALAAMEASPCPASGGAESV